MREREENKPKTQYDRLIQRREKEIRKSIQDLTKEIKTEARKDLINTFNQTASSTETNIQKKNKALKAKLRKKCKKLDEQTDLSTSSIKMMKKILKALDQYIRRPKKNQGIQITLSKLQNKQLKQLYKKQSWETITDQITHTALENTLTKFKEITEIYGRKIINALWWEVSKKDINTLSINELRKYEKRVKIKSILKEKEITNPNDIDDLRIFWRRNEITQQDLIEYFKTIQNIDYTPKSREKIKERAKEQQQTRKTNQKIEKKIWIIPLNTINTLLNHEEELNTRYNTYFPNNEVTLGQLKAYLEKKKNKLEKEILKGKKEQLTQDKITTLNETFANIEKSTLKQNISKYANQVKRQGISKTQCEQRLERRKRDDEEVASSCERRTEEIIKSFEDIWRVYSKILKTNEKKINYDKELVFNTEFKTRLSKTLLNEREKDKNPIESQWEKSVKEAIYNKICSKNKAPIIVTKIWEYRQIPFYNHKILLRLAGDWKMSVVKILPREAKKITIKKQHSNQ